MYTLCWSPKGGSGTTVVAVMLAIVSARRGPTVLVDLGGDAAPALGLDVPAGPGAGDWLARSGAGAERLWQLGRDCGTSLRLVPAGEMPATADLTELAVERLAAAAAATADHVVIDAGPGVPPRLLLQCAHRAYVVIRPCFLALRRAASIDLEGSRPVLVNEPGRSLRRLDVERALGQPVAAELPWDPAIARAVDAGLLRMRLPTSAVKALSPLVPASAIRKEDS